MEVILRETIDSLGRAGQVVNVADGYARNYLLPKKLAYPATAGNLKVIESERRTLLRKEARQKDDAEKLKRECGLDANRCEDKMWSILQPLIDDMTEKIRNALRFYQIGFPEGTKIERLYLCGGGAQFHEIDSVLSHKLTIQVRRGDALANIDKRLPKGFAAEAPLQYATAIGLGMRAADERGRTDADIP